ncbi:MAG TPA: hypothetical protein IAD02_02680 [Candidatus Enterousia intestinigallinarum]|uniref:Uncharacterized protein n=1 Tax=Candidatus Enterousia intestinigallinarum TaxID=2840790 RepID=A0A9D1JW35_9PROT|nr:hypothetical protein [Candidatus Enterousia intestinigallinarum]
MKRILFFTACGLVIMRGANAACTVTGTVYSSCKPGYYLSSNNCIACPNGGTSADKNSGGITDCYLPSGTTGSDSTGNFTYTADCHYSN